MTAGPPFVLRVTKGRPDPTELAALVAVLAALARRADVDARAAPADAAARWARLERRPAHADPRAWTTAP
ncbi:acyl-CoA carboxylase epsilon subunit [Frankia sp. AgB32]|uniref:acyl-CoA carboxylase epsilon subunit n=1 Tax=Frankia sp. AgB32 TaxID=631119 RepID=UPI00200F1620|nr:acyl-CoA carboxylase epsilon subunit [Frankia sp. AgB32]MCK9895444.1 hypothetical protein [Frankia sp. AgB32]